MKHIKFIAIATLLVVSTNAFAQSTNTIEKSSNADDWSSIYFQWNPSSIVPKRGDLLSLTGLTFGYNHAFNIASGKPLFIEAGIAIQYSFCSEDIIEEIYDDDVLDYLDYNNIDASIEAKMNMLSVKIPVNLTYKFDIPNTSVAIAPYAGLVLRGNVLGTLRVKLGSDLAAELSDRELEEIEKSHNLFSESDMGKRNTFNRFQIGWQIGTNVSFGSQCYVGISYGCDFSEICRNNKMHTTSITLGYSF